MHVFPFWFADLRVARCRLTTVGIQALLVAIAAVTHPVHVHALGKQWDLVHWPARMLERQAALTALAAHRRNGAGAAPNLSAAAATAGGVSARDALKKRTQPSTASLHAQVSAKVAVAVALPLTPDAAVVEAQRVAAALAAERTRQEVESDLREPEVRWSSPHVKHALIEMWPFKCCICFFYALFNLVSIVRFDCARCLARPLVCALSMCRATNSTALAPRYYFVILLASPRASGTLFSFFLLFFLSSVLTCNCHIDLGTPLSFILTVDAHTGARSARLSHHQGAQCRRHARSQRRQRHVAARVAARAGAVDAAPVW